MRVRVDLRGVRRRIDSMQQVGQLVLASQVLADSNNYVPELSGDLKRYSIVNNDNKTLRWTQPYARFQYYGQFSNYTKPGTGPKWDQVAKSRHLVNWIQIVERMMR